MKTINKTIQFICLIFILIITGCVTLRDTLPPGTPKGYVEFYYRNSKSEDPTGHTIYCLVDNQKVYEGRTSFWNMTKGKIGLRIAKSPGTYTFFIKHYTSNDYIPFTVQIEEGMITPVKMAFIPEWISDGRGGEYEVNRLELLLEAVVPIAEYKRK